MADEVVPVTERPEMKFSWRTLLAFIAGVMALLVILFGTIGSLEAVVVLAVAIMLLAICHIP